MEITERTEDANNSVVAYGQNASQRIEGALMPRLEEPPADNNSRWDEPASTTKAMKLSDFLSMRIIGTGCFSVVRIVQTIATGQVFALKVMKKVAVVVRKNVNRVLSERCILSKVHHPLIVNYCGSFQDVKNLYLLMEYVPGGELYSLLSKRGTLMSREAKFYAAEVAQVLTYLHSEGVVYRDLKPENILISASGHIKLTDFGLAKMMKQGERTFSMCGTPQYLAPEVVQKSGHSFGYDWWTFGVLLYEMLTGYTPFDAETPYDLYSNIISKDFEMPKDADSVTNSFIRGLLTKDPNERFLDEEVLHHQYFQDIDLAHLDVMVPPHVPVLQSSLDDSHFDHYEEMRDTTEIAQFDDSVFRSFNSRLI